MATFRNARKSGKNPEQKIVKADNLKIEPEVVEIEEQPVVVVKETKKISRKNSTQDNQLLGGN